MYQHHSSSYIFGSSGSHNVAKNCSWSASSSSSSQKKEKNETFVFGSCSTVPVPGNGILRQKILQSSAARPNGIKSKKHHRDILKGKSSAPVMRSMASQPGTSHNNADINFINANYFRNNLYANNDKGTDEEKSRCSMPRVNTELPLHFDGTGPGRMHPADVDSSMNTFNANHLQSSSFPNNDKDMNKAKDECSMPWMNTEEPLCFNSIYTAHMHPAPDFVGNSFVFKLILIVYLSLYFAIFNLYNLENPYVMIKALCLLVKLLVHANVLLVSWVKFFTIIGLGALCYFALYCYIYMLCYLQPDISIILFGSKSWDF